MTARSKIGNENLKWDEDSGQWMIPYVKGRLTRTFLFGVILAAGIFALIMLSACTRIPTRPSEPPVVVAASMAKIDLVSGIVTVSYEEGGLTAPDTILSNITEIHLTNDSIRLSFSNGFHLYSSEGLFWKEIP